MKKAAITLACVCFAMCAYAQDHVVLKDGTDFDAKVENVKETTLEYRKWSNLNGPLYSVEKSKVLYVKYENGEKEIMNTEPVAVAPVNYGYAQRYQRKTSFRGYFDAVGLVSKMYGGPGVTLSLGANIMDYVYVGLESGFDCMFIYNDYVSGSGWSVPLGVDTKVYIPTGNINIVPYTELTIGAAFVGSGAIFHSYLGFGCQFSRFNVAIGWDRMDNENSFGIKLGFFFGSK